MNDIFIKMHPSVKFFLTIWLSVFSVLHLIGTLPWLDIGLSLWIVSAWLNVMAILWIFYWGVLNKTVSLLSALSLSWVSYFLVWLINAEDWFEWSGVNAQAIRMLFSSMTLVFGIFAIWKKNRPHLNRMMIIGGMGVIAIQGMHAVIFNYSYSAIEEMVKKEHEIVITHSNQNDIFKECKQRMWMCVRGSKEDTYPPQFHPNKYTVHTVALARQFLKESMKNEQHGVSSWSWHDGWIKQPNAIWPVIFTHSRQGDGVQWIVVDTGSMLSFVEKHKLYFSIMSTLGSVVWICGSLFVWWFHRRRWNKKRIKQG